jgi:translation initiation factor 1
VSKRIKNLTGIVYSTNPDFNYQNPSSDEPETPPASQQDLRVWLEYQGGKAVTIIRNFVGSLADIEKLGKELKIKCGVGGTTKNGMIVIQGNQREKVIAILHEKGYKAKKAGG